MAATRTVLKQYFKKYATPTEEQFAALIDAFVHKDEDSLTQSKIDGLTAALESKVSSSDLASAVATAVAETLQGGNIEVTHAAHQHDIADVEGLQAFVNKVNNFLESADVSDETINRWVEIETFLTGITDQETLTGLLLNLKNEILAQIPEPQTGNYLKQISDLDAYTEAQEGEIVQYVGTSTADYTRGFCYEKKQGYSINLQPYSSYVINVPEGIPNTPSGLYWTSRESPETITESVSTPTCLYETGDGTQYKGCAESIIAVGDVLFSPTGSSADTIPSAKITAINKNQYGEVELLTLQTGETLVPIRNSYSNRQGNNVYVLRNVNGEALYSSDCYNYGAYNNGVFRMYGGVKESVNIVEINETEPSTWQPIATSPAVS